jgi:carbamoyltransferase
MRILGVGGLNHDPSVALIDGSKIALAIESEKVTRHKHEVSVCPEEAIRLVLRQTGIDLSEVDVMTTNWDARPLANWLYLKQVLRFVRSNCYPWYLLPMFAGIAGSHHKASFLRLQEDRLPPIVPIQHHLAHLGSCYTLSDFEEAAVAIIDGSGEVECTSLYHCRGSSVQKLYSMDLPLDSLGHIYTMATIHLGYRMLGDEYKVMGLAAYGEPRKKFTDFFADLIQLLPEGRYRVNGKLAGNYMASGYKFPLHVRSLIGPPRPADADMTREHEDFAYALQARLEEAVVHVIRHLRKVTGSRNLCLAGGVALNSVANGKIREQVDFENIFIQPAAHDAGTALGAAAYYQYHVLKGDRPDPMTSAYLGPAYGDEHIEAELGRTQARYRRVDDVAGAAAQLIAEGRIIGWFQGAAEFGPRALGARSILADPRQGDMKDRVNKMIKEREGYRPFAPSVLVEEMSTYFDLLTESPYMLMIAKVKPERRAEIPAVVHVDGTARPQSVSRHQNATYYDLISRFRERTGVPVVLNTSFNVAGEPIVLKPADALRCFYGSGLDALVIGSYVLEKGQ